jgi:hypothetical protein
MWQLTPPQAPTKSAKYTVSFTADVRGIPANELGESTKLIGRLAELGGDVRALHIQVDSVFSNDAMFEVLRPKRPVSITAWREAS